MTRNYNLNNDDYDTIYNNWSAEANEKYGMDLNGVWYKNDSNEYKV